MSCDLRLATDINDGRCQKAGKGGPGTGEAAARVRRVPAAHTEGYLEGFPTIEDGLRGMQFVDACVRSSKRDGAWVKLAP